MQRTQGRHSGSFNRSMKTFQCTDTGVFLTEDRNGKKVTRQICSPVRIVADTRDEHGRNWGRLFEWRDGDGRLHTWAIPNELFHALGKAVIQGLRSNGLTIWPGQEKEVMEYMQDVRPAGKKLICVSQTGWHGENYVLPDEILQPGKNQDVVFQSKHPLDHRYSISGTEADWREHVASKCVGNSRLLLSMSCAFAGSVLHMLGEESGGFHLFGETSGGKSTSVITAVSALGGGGPLGFAESWLTTANALEGSAALHNDSCLALDEITLAPASQIANIVYTLTGGQAKNRMTADTTIRERRIWRLTILSSGELTIEQHANSEGQVVRGGIGIRVLNIPADAGAGIGAFETIHGAATPKEFADSLKRAALAYYGAPLRTWLRMLVDNREAWVEILRETVKDFEQANTPADSSREVQRAIRRFAVWAAAGELATVMGITGWPEGQAIWAAARCLEAWIEQRGGTGSTDAAEMVRVVRLFLQRHGHSRFKPVMMGLEVGSESVRDLAGYVQSDCFLFSTEVFRTEVCRGYDHKAVCRALDANKLLKHNGRRWDYSARINGVNSRYYAVKKQILSDPVIADAPDS
jgi:putative DNA primase/helicase